MKPIKVLRIIARLNIGGPAIHAILLTRGLDPKLFDSTLVTGRVSPDEGDMSYLAEAQGVRPWVIEELGREVSFLDDWRALRKIYREIRRRQPDIVHTHTAKAGTLGRLAGIFFNSRERVRRFFGGRPPAHRVVLIHTFHGHVFHSYFPPLKTRAFLWIERFLARFSDRLLAVSEGQRRELSEIYRIAPASKIVVVPLGFDLAPFLDRPSRRATMRRRLGVDEDCILVGTIGRLAPVKNQAMLLRVAQRIMGQGQATPLAMTSGGVGAASSKGSHPAVRFLFVGDGEQRPSLERLAGELGVTDIVSFIGWEKDIHLVYAALDVVVLTSLNEGTPVTLIEAAAAGKPVVSTDAGGVRDIVEDGRSGYLTPVNDDDLFHQRLLDLVRDATKRRAFGEQGRATVLAKHSQEALLRRIATIYQEQTQGSTKPSRPR